MDIFFLDVPTSPYFNLGISPPCTASAPGKGVQGTMEISHVCPSQPATVGQDSSVVLAGRAPGEHISTRIFQAKLRCCVETTLFWGRCAGKQAGFHCTCLIFCQLICLADGLMTEECWYAKLGLFSCLEVGWCLELFTLRQTTKMMPPELLLPKSPCLWGCPSCGASWKPHVSDCFSSTFTSAWHL